MNYHERTSNESKHYGNQNMQPKNNLSADPKIKKYQ